MLFQLQTHALQYERFIIKKKKLIFDLLSFNIDITP